LQKAKANYFKAASTTLGHLMKMASEEEKPDLNDRRNELAKMANTPIPTNTPTPANTPNNASSSKGTPGNATDKGNKRK
jgi:hypothetical protein